MHYRLTTIADAWQADQATLIEYLCRCPWGSLAITLNYMGSVDAWFGVMFWSALALPPIGFGLCVVIGVLLTPVEMNRTTRRTVIAVGVLLVLLALPGLALLLLV